MSDITQRLGFDTSQGVEALNNLSKAIEQVNDSIKRLNRASLSRVNKALENLNKSLGLAGDAASGAGRKVQGFATGIQSNRLSEANRQLNVLNENFQIAGKRAERLGGALRSSLAAFQLLGFARRGLSDITDLLLEASDASREFQQAIAEVQTIAGGAEFGELSQAIRELSIEFGRPTVEQAEAAYQAFSNQVIQSTQDIGFLDDANRLAIATVSETGDAVGVLSSVINSYGLEVSEATNVSDVLFKTVELGRTRLSEFANSLGTVTPLARNAGIEFEEIAASLAAITRSGTTTSVALTQIRGIVNKILKPTELLSQAFAEFGATDGPSAIEAAGGLIPLLQRLEEFADRNNVSLNQLFGRVRAGAGVLNLLRDNARDVTEILRELENATGATQKAFETIDATDAREAEKAFNELSVTVEQLGDKVVPVLVDIVQAINAIIPNAETLGAVLAGAAAALTVLGGAAAIALANFIGFGAIGAFLLPIAPLLLGIAAATGLAVFELNRLNQERERSIELATFDARKAEAAAKDVLQAEQERLEGVKQARQDTIDFIEDIYQQDIQNARDANQEIKANLDSVVDSFVDSRKRVLNEIQNAIKAADNEIKRSADIIAEAQNELDQLDFDKSIRNLDKGTQAVKTLERAQKIAAESRRELANAGLNEEAARAARNKRNAAEQQLRDAEQLASASNNDAVQRRIEAGRRKFLKDIIRDEKNRSSTVERLQEDAIKKQQEVEEAIKKQNVAVQDLNISIQKSLDILTDWKTGPEEAEDATRNLISAVRELDAITRGDVTQGLAAQVGAGDELAQGNQQLQRGVAEAIFDADQVRRQVQDALGEAPFEAVARLKEIDQEVQLKVNEAQANAEIAALKTKLQEQLVQQSLEVPVVPGELGNFEAGAQVVAGSLLELVTDLDLVTGTAAQFSQRMKEITQDVQNLDQAGVENAQNAVANAQKVLDGLQIDSGQAKAAQESINRASQILSTQEEILKKQGDAAKAAADAVPTKANEGTTAMKNLGGAAKDASDQVQGIGTAAQTSASQLFGASTSAIGRLQAVEQQAQRTARAVQASLAGGGGTVPAFFGRQVHRQTGGLTRGQDRILASVAPEEFIVNARNSRRFRSQLTAINAGQAPQFRETGGSVTNVGDINLNIQTQDASNISGRSLARELKRELRTRTSSL